MDPEKLILFGLIVTCIGLLMDAYSMRKRIEKLERESKFK